MTSTITLTLVDGVQIVVPDSLNLMTPYVLLEQQDWFEDEIKFLRNLLQPGQKVIDIGANYGTYTLSMAKKVGLTGNVWCFEPASSTAKLLAEGIAINGFTQIVLEQSALSNVSGEAQLFLNDNSELNSLVHGNQSTNTSETVPLVTLDECLEKYGWQDIEFMKIDAEGEESNILKGGKRFLAELSPLIQYEIKAGADLQMELVQNFAALGYNSYRLVPELDLLVPFNTEAIPDGYLLNLFCCKPDRAQKLAARDFLITGAEHFQDISEKLKGNNVYDWHHTIAKLPYGIQLSNLWKSLVATESSNEVYKALAFYAVSQDSFLSSAERFAALEASFKLLNSVCECDPSYLRLASLARVARDYGARSIAVNSVQQLSDTIFQHNTVELSEPFLAPEKRFDAIPPNEAMGDWVLAAVLEKFERIGSFSSFYTYTRTSIHQPLETIRDLGFGSAEMERRLHLVQKRFGISNTQPV
jgi:FkbM family methyltransferase